MPATTNLDAPPTGPVASDDSVVRDDLLVLIHKALRYGLFGVAMEAGATDWTDAESVEGLHERWLTIERLIRSHAEHEDRHIFALLEAKEPGATQELGIGHDEVERELDQVSAKMLSATEARDPAAGLVAYRALTHLVGTAMAHFAAEEPAVMERLWRTCSDEEIAACRAAFMAEISPEEGAATYELMFPAVAPGELMRILGAVRAGAPEPVFRSLTAVAERTLSPVAWARIERQLRS